MALPSNVMASINQTTVSLHCIKLFLSLASWKVLPKTVAVAVALKKIFVYQANAYHSYKLFNDQNKSWVTNKSIILLYNLYLSLATRFLYNYTHYQAISVTIFCKKTVLSDFIKSLLKPM